MIELLQLISFAFIMIWYFLPSYNAYEYNHRNKNVILILNFLFGWTVIGWIALNLWACHPQKK